jgi:hypothetical protein
MIKILFTVCYENYAKRFSEPQKLEADKAGKKPARRVCKGSLKGTCAFPSSFFY